MPRDLPSAIYSGKSQLPEPGSVAKSVILDELIADDAAVFVGWILHHVHPRQAWEN